MSAPRIIGLIGLIGSGKSTVGDRLKNPHGYQQESFARSLKDAVANIFGWPRHLLEGDTQESREWREKEDPWWTEALDMGRPITPRWVLQYWGTEVGREHFHQNIWIRSLEHRILNAPDQKFVIADARFQNELDMVKSLGGELWRIKRGPEPEWWEVAQVANFGPDPSAAGILMPSGVIKAAAKQRMDKEFKIHPSEWSWVGSEFDKTLTNDSTLEALYEQVDFAL